jgi:uncharacterized DUF497 family protein
VAAMTLNFEWDEKKARENLKNHKISFDEAITVFNDSFSVTIPDPDHSENEQRFIDIGTSAKGHMLVVVYTEKKGNVRIISCRKATQRERKIYEEDNE